MFFMVNKSQLSYQNVFGKKSFVYFVLLSRLDSQGVFYQIHYFSIKKTSNFSSQVPNLGGLGAVWDTSCLFMVNKLPYLRR